MAYSTPRTWVAGSYPTAAQFNQDIRDNVAFLANPPACRATRTTPQSIPHDTYTAISFTSETGFYDTAGLHDTATNPSRFTAPVAGIYDIKANVLFLFNATGRRGIFIRANGTGLDVPTHGWVLDSAATAGDQGLSIATDVKLAAGGWIEVIVYQDCGVALNAIVFGGAPFCTVRWAGLG